MSVGGLGLKIGSMGWVFRFLRFACESGARGARRVVQEPVCLGAEVHGCLWDFWESVAWVGGFSFFALV